MRYEFEEEVVLIRALEHFQGSETRVSVLIRALEHFQGWRDESKCSYPDFSALSGMET